MAVEGVVFIDELAGCADTIKVVTIEAELDDTLSGQVDRLQASTVQQPRNPFPQT